MQIKPNQIISSLSQGLRRHDRPAFDILNVGYSHAVHVMSPSNDVVVKGGILDVLSTFEVSLS